MKVTGMLDDDEAVDSLAEMQVEIEWHGRTLGAPLAQLVGIDVNEETAEVIGDWIYWVAQGGSSDDGIRFAAGERDKGSAIRPMLPTADGLCSRAVAREAQETHQ